ncbi:transglycosylase family protein [Streptomyces sp. WMMC500]|uniref:transglycosylase family protein n=1 Tax=Streptomyces sp. WMMC500 TaxID=3015154 RepID=UPI00248D25C1|nr:transglycosylase family protein [Streptomyces sp. WMMC500]WBB58917.1 transglycosylase family protein [Streptomyces sp. WMMC500]
MRSGNGRHRRPRQAPAFVVAAGATGAGLALPLLGASGASAADAGTWDRVAECESGGLWSADEGNGYYGGLQLTMDMWQEYGGEEFASQPDFASRAQQITVAERILAGMGADRAWPECAEDAGLDGDDAVPEVDPGAELPLPPTAPPTLAPDPGATDGSQGGEKDGDRRTDREDKRDAEDGDRDAEKGTEGGGKHRGTQDPDERDGGSGESAGRDSDTTGASEGTGRHRAPDASATPTPSDTPPSAPEAPREAVETPGSSQSPDASEVPDTGREWIAEIPGDDTGQRSGNRGSDGSGGEAAAGEGSYTVRPGDTLSDIASEHSLAGGWSELYDGNKNSLGADPDNIKPGQELELSGN